MLSQNIFTYLKKNEGCIIQTFLVHKRELELEPLWNKKLMFSYPEKKPPCITQPSSSSFDHHKRLKSGENLHSSSTVQSIVFCHKDTITKDTLFLRQGMYQLPMENKFTRKAFQAKELTHERFYPRSFLRNIQTIVQYSV